MRALRSCLWVVLACATPGLTGQSFNIYDRVAGKWHQTWVDSSGDMHEYRGGLVDGNMTYEGDIPAPRGGEGGSATVGVCQPIGQQNLQ